LEKFCRGMLPPVAITASAATASAATTIPATAAAATAAITSASAARRTFLTGTRLIHRQGAALKFLAVKLGDRRVGLGL